MEEWRDIPGLNGLYQVSIDVQEGRCRRKSKNGNIRELNNKPDKNNRLSWRLCGRTQQAARWIAITFPELVQNEYFEGAQIDHIDTNPMNNHPLNLRWVTLKDNHNNPLTIEHYRQVAFKRIISEETRKKFRKRIVQLTKDNEVVNAYESLTEAAKETNIRIGDICRVCKGNRKSAGGFIWSYDE